MINRDLVVASFNSRGMEVDELQAQPSQDMVFNASTGTGAPLGVPQNTECWGNVVFVIG